MKNETSDIMNVVEVSEYEKELTKHKPVKINLEYIFSLYLEKFHCLFKYKEIEFETHFEKLRNLYVTTGELKNLYVVTDEFNFIYYIRQIYTYLYYIVPKKEGFIFQYIEEKDSIKIIIKKKTNLYEDESNLRENKNNKDIKSDMARIIQTKEMTKEVLYSMSKKLNFLLEIGNTNIGELSSRNNFYLSITIPVHKKDKSDLEDEFKDEDINEMIQKDAMVLDNKLKRNLPSYDNCIRRSSNYLTDESSINFKKDKDKHLKLYSNNNLHIITRHSDNYLNHYEARPKIIINSNKTKETSSFLNKCLKTNENIKNIYGHHRVRSDNFIKINTVKPKVRNHCSDKSVLYNDYSQKNENENKSQKLSGIFTKINNLGIYKDLDYNEISISNATEVQKNKKDKIVNSKLKDNQIKEGTNKTKGSSGIKSDFKNSKFMNSDALEKENNNNINININTNHIINIITNDNYSQKNRSKDNSPMTKTEKRTQLETINQPNYNLNSPREIDQKQNKILSKNNAGTNLKDCMTFDADKKENSKEKKTVLNEGINQNEDLFIKANKEREMHLKDIKQNNYNSNSELDDEEESEEKENYNNYNKDDNIVEEKEQEEENNCNCLDILIVDDEEFNVMASKKMIKNLGYESEAAYNGQECINLIKQKQKLNCTCNKNYYKLIFLDIVMPILDGIKTAKKIQEMIDNKEISNNIKIIFISGNIDGNEIKESLLKINCVKECLQKPVRIDKYQKIFEKYYQAIK